MDFTRELQKILDLVVTLLMEGVARVAAPIVVVSNEDTAATDGAAYVKMPQTFLGKNLSEQMTIAIGLLAHEIGHWLQPLSAIREVERETGLSHDVSNLLLDIQLEANVVRIFPLFQFNLNELRAATAKQYRAQYQSGMKQAETFLEATVYALLFGRFCVQSDRSFSTMFNQCTKFPKVKDVLDDASVFTLATSRQLPDLLKEFAQKYPELCDPSHKDDGKGGGSFKPLAPDPTAEVSSGNVEGLISLISAALAVYSGAGECKEIVGTLHGKINPDADVLAVCRMIQKRWEVPRSTGVLIGPGRMNRLSAYRGDPIPFEIHSPKGRALPETKVVLVADWSGSMNGSRWRETIRAAQSVTLAIRNSGGDVRGAIFEGELIHDKDFSAEVFFSTEIGTLSLTTASGMETSFGWLPLIWQRFPQHRIVVLTDGNGLYPSVVPLACRKRTSAILLQVSAVDKPMVQATVRRFAEKFVHVTQLDEIASAWAVVIPRRAM
jgi:hypothetical protein